MAWITVQTHMNVVAVASLHEFAAIILGGRRAQCPPEVLAKAGGRAHRRFLLSICQDTRFAACSMTLA